MLPRFPFSLLGSVHLSSTIHANVPPSLCMERTVTVTAQVTDFEYHKRGTIAVIRCAVVDNSAPASGRQSTRNILWSAEHRMLFFHAQASKPSVSPLKTSPSPPVAPESSPDIALGLTLGKYSRSVPKVQFLHRSHHRTRPWSTIRGRVWRLESDSRPHCGGEAIRLPPHRCSRHGEHFPSKFPPLCRVTR
jgi:hypothetical protein